MANPTIQLRVRTPTGMRQFQVQGSLPLSAVFANICAAVAVRPATHQLCGGFPPRPLDVTSSQPLSDHVAASETLSLRKAPASAPAPAPEPGTQTQRSEAPARQPRSAKLAAVASIRAELAAANRQAAPARSKPKPSQGTKRRRSGGERGGAGVDGAAQKRAARLAAVQRRAVSAAGDTGALHTAADGAVHVVPPDMPRHSIRLGTLDDAMLSLMQGAEGAVLGGGDGASLAGRFFRAAFRNATALAWERRKANQRFAAGLTGWFKADPIGGSGGGAFAGMQRYRVSFATSNASQNCKWEEEEVSCVPAPLLAATLKQVHSTGQGSAARENLKPHIMSLVSPNMFWSLLLAVGAPASTALQRFLPKLDWGFLEARARKQSTKGIASAESEAQWQAYTGKSQAGQPGAANKPDSAGGAAGSLALSAGQCQALQKWLEMSADAWDAALDASGVGADGAPSGDVAELIGRAGAQAAAAQGVTGKGLASTTIPPVLGTPEESDGQWDSLLGWLRDHGDLVGAIWASLEAGSPLSAPVAAQEVLECSEAGQHVLLHGVWVLVTKLATVWIGRARAAETQAALHRVVCGGQDTGTDAPVTAKAATRHALHTLQAFGIHSLPELCAFDADLLADQLGASGVRVPAAHGGALTTIQQSHVEAWQAQAKAVLAEQPWMQSPGQ